MTFAELLANFRVLSEGVNAFKPNPLEVLNKVRNVTQHHRKETPFRLQHNRQDLFTRLNRKMSGPEHRDIFRAERERKQRSRRHGRNTVDGFNVIKPPALRMGMRLRKK